jgi:hypothetical protein
MNRILNGINTEENLGSKTIPERVKRPKAIVEPRTHKNTRILIWFSLAR